MRSKKTIFISTILLFVCMGIIAAASGKYKIKFHNQSNEIVTYAMYQIDHKLDYSKPIAFVMGTLEPGKSWVVNWEPGFYYIEWKSVKTDQVLLKTKPFQLDKDLIFVIGKLSPSIKA